MKALQFSRTGDLAALDLLELPTPTPAADEVLIEIKAAGLNPSDVKNVLGRFPYTTLPRTPGRDYAGVIVAGPAHLQGVEVWGSGKELGFTREGSHAQYLSLPADAVARKPAALSFAQAATCGVPYITALDALERSQVGAGTRLLVIGSGAVGNAALALARARGAQVVAGVRRAEVREQLRAAGIEAILLSSAENLPTQVEQAFGQAAEVIFDTTGFWLPASVNALARFGRIAVIAAPVDGHVDLPVLSLYRRGGVIVGVNSLLYTVQESVALLDRIGRYFDRGELPLPQGFREVALDQALVAYQRCYEGSSEKVVLLPGAD
ncbi:zinc-binding alcohol dehydrogenase family protein [Pseudomonas cavernae]|uniref:Zinc-binding alcohol dehydrogenase family protein n=1 Tax=Pseudomonas cavernae TaxID=2320867 RepID=A0A385YZW0_9PSED|nr:zinc-binding alcohol dehydrogenase family protein [Pseudomonas cavernae]AYC32479.1 zinc-binding alcohol dehydrogenase family protein [Pseudomonas cavernae]